MNEVNVTKTAADYSMKILFNDGFYESSQTMDIVPVTCQTKGLYLRA